MLLTTGIQIWHKLIYLEAVIQIQLSSEKANELNQKSGRSNSAIVSDSKVAINEIFVTDDWKQFK